MTNKTIAQMLEEDKQDENLARCRQVRRELYAGCKTSDDVIARAREIEAMIVREERAEKRAKLAALRSRKTPKSLVHGKAS